MKKMHFDIQGMSCASCQAHVTKAVEKLEGTKNVNVNLLTNDMTVDIDENKVDSKKIIQAIENAGYGATISSDDISSDDISNKNIPNDNITSDNISSDSISNESSSAFLPVGFITILSSVKFLIKISLIIILLVIMILEIMLLVMIKLQLQNVKYIHQIIPTVTPLLQNHFP